MSAEVAVRELLAVTAIAFTPAPARPRATGLIGWVAVTVGELRLDGLAVRRTEDGRTILLFPGRVDRKGSRHPIVAPTTNETRRAIEAQVIAVLRQRGDLP